MAVCVVVLFQQDWIKIYLKNKLKSETQNKTLPKEVIEISNLKNIRLLEILKFLKRCLQNWLLAKLLARVCLNDHLARTCKKILPRLLAREDFWVNKNVFQIYFKFSPDFSSEDKDEETVMSEFVREASFLWIICYSSKNL